MITHVAIRFQGKTWSLPPPNRHHDIIRLIVRETGVKYVDTREDDQGFLINGVDYFRRRPALRHAQDCNQLKPDCLGEKLGKLYSEDVWQTMLGPCSKAFENTNGKWLCTRDEQHDGPCAAIPVVLYEQIALETGVMSPISCEFSCIKRDHYGTLRCPNYTDGSLSYLYCDKHFIEIEFCK